MVIWSLPVEDMEAENDDVHNRNLLFQLFIFMLHPFVWGFVICQLPSKDMKCFKFQHAIHYGGAWNAYSQHWLLQRAEQKIPLPWDGKSRYSRWWWDWIDWIGNYPPFFDHIKISWTFISGKSTIVSHENPYIIQAKIRKNLLNNHITCSNGAICDPLFMGCSWVALQQQLGIWTIGSHPITFTCCETRENLGISMLKPPRTMDWRTWFGYFGQIFFEKRSDLAERVWMRSFCAIQLLYYCM